LCGTAQNDATATFIFQSSTSEDRSAGMDKPPFDIGVALDRIERAVQPWPKAALFQLAEEGYASTFEQLLACIISIRTYDEVTLPIARKLFARARLPVEVARLSAQELDALISPSTFHERKAHQILAIARDVAERFGATLPCDRDVLLSFAGVGPKCANLVLGVACGTPVISVDIHVHRVTGRWGYVQATTPEKTLAALEATLPQRYWIDINRLLVPFGKHICTGTRPKCSTCPVLDMCRQVGVGEHR
jgi:endonuclease-3